MGVVLVLAVIKYSLQVILVLIFSLTLVESGSRLTSLVLKTEEKELQVALEPLVAVADSVVLEL